jgi:hypothetical protein
LVAYFFFNYYRLGWWLQAQLKLVCCIFFKFSTSGLVAASSVVACLLYIFPIFNVSVRELAATSPDGSWLQAQLELGI